MFMRPRFIGMPNGGIFETLKSLAEPLDCCFDFRSTLRCRSELGIERTHQPGIGSLDLRQRRTLLHPQQKIDIADHKFPRPAKCVRTKTFGMAQALARHAVFTDPRMPDVTLTSFPPAFPHCQDAVAIWEA